MALILPIITGIIGIIVFITIIIVKVTTSKSIKKLDITENTPDVQVDKFRKRFTDGHTRGRLKSMKLCKNGCTRIEIYPTDIEEGEDKKRPDFKAFMVRDEFLKKIPRGDDSDYREMIISTTPFTKDLPENLRNTKEGFEITKKGQDAFLESMHGDWTRSGIEALKDAMTLNSNIGITKQALYGIIEETDFIKKLKQIQEKEKIDT